MSLVRRESNSGAYFAGMFRVANVEFIPEYRQAESNEFVSMANKIQHVVCIHVNHVWIVEWAYWAQTLLPLAFTYSI